MNFTDDFLGQVAKTAELLDREAIDEVADILADVRKEKGRVFVVGVGGSAGNGTHLTNDFRKLCNIETYCVTDNVSELTARVNDEGWDVSFANMLRGNNLKENDCLFVLSVGGGNKEKNVSVNLIRAIDFAQDKGCSVVGIIGRDGGYTGQVADKIILVPTVDPDHVTPISESFQGVLWHLLVTHPKLKVNATTW